MGLSKTKKTKKNQMRILHVIDNLSMGGGQNLLIGLAGIQHEIGNEVTVLALVPCADQLVKNKIEAEGVIVKVLPSTMGLYNPLQIFLLMPWLKNYDVVHVHLFPALYWVGFAKKLSGSRTPIVYTEHSTKNRRRENLVLRRVDAVVYKYCYNKVIACAGKALETYRKVYPNVKNVCAINNGVDTAKYWAAEPYTKQELLGISEDCFVVTMVARFMFMKRQDTIVEAIRKLPVRFHACFVGGEPKDNGLLIVKALAEELGVSDRVHFLYLRPDVPKILKTSDVVVMSSEYEGLSLSSIEGMAAGKPFLATNVNGLREIVRGAGELFGLCNSDELARILLRLDADNGYYETVASRCRKRASEYDIHRMVSQYMEVYKEVINEQA